jgi:ribosomal protein L9
MPKKSTANKTIPVILLVDDKTLGEKYEEVRVAPIYAKNVLFPQAKAVPADKMNRHNFAAKMASAQKAREAKASSLEDFLQKIITDGGISFEGKVNENNVLYAKIDEHNIADKINEIYNTSIDPHYIKLKNKLATPGIHEVVYNYREISRIIPVTIKAEGGGEDTTTQDVAANDTSAEDTNS